MFDVSHLGSVRVARPGAVAGAAVGVHQRPRSHRPGTGAVHPPARPRRRARRRRHHRVVGRRRRAARDAERVEHRPIVSTLRGRDRGAGAAGARSRTSPRRGRCSRCRGPRRASAARRRRRPRRRRCRASRWPVSAGAAWIASSPAPGTPVRMGSRSTCPPSTRRRSGGRSSPPGSRPPGSGARDTLRLEAGLPAARSRARAGHHAAPGRAGLGGALRQGRLPRSRRRSLAEKERGVARRLRGLLVDGRRPPRAGYPVHAGRRHDRRGDERELLADARARDRARVPAARHRGRRRGARSRCAGPPRARDRGQAAVRRRGDARRAALPGRGESGEPPGPATFGRPGSR